MDEQSRRYLFQVAQFELNVIFCHVEPLKKQHWVFNSSTWAESHLQFAHMMLDQSSLMLFQEIPRSGMLGESALGHGYSLLWMWNGFK